MWSDFPSAQASPAFVQVIILGFRKRCSKVDGATSTMIMITILIAMIAMIRQWIMIMTNNKWWYSCRTDIDTSYAQSLFILASTKRPRGLCHHHPFQWWYCCLCLSADFFEFSRLWRGDSNYLQWQEVQSSILELSWISYGHACVYMTSFQK